MENCPEIASESAPDTAGKVRLRSLSDLDGRTGAAKRTRALIAAIESDLGGDDRLSAGEREIAQRAALVGAVLEDAETAWLSGQPLDIAAYTTLANTQSRLLKLLGLQRRPRDATPALAAYIEAHAVPPPPPPPKK